MRLDTFICLNEKCATNQPSMKPLKRNEKYELAGISKHKQCGYCGKRMKKV